MPRILILAGPNGAVKTTFAKQFLPNEAQVLQFVNADMIAAGISPFDPASANVTAGRGMIKRLEDRANEGVDFALTNSPRHHFLRIARLTSMQNLLRILNKDAWYSVA